MNKSYSWQDGYPYQVITPLFEGPLELLLYLIEKAELDITKLSIGLVTDQFIAYLNTISDKDPQLVSSFLIVASKLLLIKSEMLLPRPFVREEGQEDPGELMAQQLREYKKFKLAATYLDDLENENLRTYLKESQPVLIKEFLDIGDTTGYDLLMIFKSFLENVDENSSHATTIINRVNIKDKVRIIYDLLNHQKRTTFIQLLSKSDSWVDIVVTFLAVLELVKQRWIKVKQELMFGDMELEVADGVNEFDWNNFIYDT